MLTHTVQLRRYELEGKMRELTYEKAKAAGLPHHWRYAFLKDHGDDSLGIIETVMKNAGYLLNGDTKQATHSLKEYS